MKWAEMTGGPAGCSIREGLDRGGTYAQRQGEEDKTRWVCTLRAVCRGKTQVGGGPPTLSALRHLCGLPSDLDRRRMTHRSAWPEGRKDVTASEELSQTAKQGRLERTTLPPWTEKTHVNKLWPPVNDQLNIKYLQHNFSKNAINLLKAASYCTLQHHPLALCAEGTLPLSAECPKTVSVESISVGTSPRAYYQYRPRPLSLPSI